MPHEKTFVVNPDFPSGPAVCNEESTGHWTGDSFSAAATIEEMWWLYDQHGILHDLHFADGINYSDVVISEEFFKQYPKVENIREELIERGCVIDENLSEPLVHILPQNMKNIDEVVYRSVRATLAKVSEENYEKLMAEDSFTAATIVNSLDGCQKILELASDAATLEAARHYSHIGGHTTINELPEVAREVLKNEVALYKEAVLKNGMIEGSECPGTYLDPELASESPRKKSRA